MSKSIRPRTQVKSTLDIYLSDISETPLLEDHQEAELASRIAEGDLEARDHMVKANLRLVVNIARGYLGKGLSLEDLIEEGNLGLMRAVQSFDLLRGYRFSTYAAYWIKQAIRRMVINHGHPIRHPAYMVTLLYKWRQACKCLTEKLERPPTPKEIGKSLGLRKKTLAIVTKAASASREDLSGVTDQYGNTLLDEAVDTWPTSDVQVEEDELAQKILECMSGLEYRERLIVQWRFGLGDEPPQTNREIGLRLKVTREWTRKLLRRALAKLHAWADPDDLLAAWANTDPGGTKTNGAHSNMAKRKAKVKCVQSADTIENEEESGAIQSQEPEPIYKKPSAASQRAKKIAAARLKAGRRNMIDPTTCNRQQTGDEIELGRVMLKYQQERGSRNPSPGEILAQAKAVLGYQQIAPKVELRFNGGQFEDGQPAAPTVRDQPAIHEVVVDVQKTPGTAEELAAQEFGAALTYYKRCAGRPFPTWSEILEVMISLGYRKVPEPE